MIKPLSCFFFLIHGSIPQADSCVLTQHLSLSALYLYSSFSFGRKGKASALRSKEWSQSMTSTVCQGWKANPVSSGCDRCFQKVLLHFSGSCLCKPGQQQFSYNGRFCCCGSIVAVGHS